MASFAADLEAKPGKVDSVASRAAALRALALKTPREAARWLAFERPSAAALAPDRLAVAAPESAGPARSRAAHSARVGRRFGAYALERLGAAATLEVAPIGRRRLALLEPASLMDAARWAGAAWRAEELRSLIFGPDRRAVAEALGDRAVVFGVRNHDLAAVAARYDRPEAIAKAIERDARRLLRAWIEREPASFSIRLGARLGDAALGATAPADRHRRRCFVMFDRVTREWFDDDDRS